MALSRKQFLHLMGCGTLTVAAAPALGANQRRLRVLVLGGTNYVGPHIVAAALARGHDVTMFNRGFTNPGLFPGVGRLGGNRYPDRGRGLAALSSTRNWDLVIDTWSGPPGCCDATARILADRCERYVYISSIAVYGSFREIGLDETSPSLDATAHRTSFDPDLAYPVRKRAAELAITGALGNRTIVVRCSSIYGFDHARSPLNQQLYWPLRFVSGEVLLQPQDARAPMQWSDVSAVAGFVLDLAETEGSGIYNAVSAPTPLSSYLETWRAETGGRSPVMEADRAFLDRHSVLPFVDLPIWIPQDDPEPGFFAIASPRAISAGYRQRPLRDTVRDVIAAFGGQWSPDAASGGMRRERELGLIALMG